MKTFLFLLGLVAACILGYSFEPDLRFQLTGQTPVKGNAKPGRMAVVPVPPEQAIDPASFPADQLPEKILLKSSAEIADPASDLKMTITAGSRVNLIRLAGQNVIISPGAGPLEGSVPIDQTDLLEQLAALPKNPPPAPTEPEVAVTTPAEPEMPVLEPAPAPEPTPEPEPPVPTGPVDVVAVMQGSIKAGRSRSFPSTRFSTGRLPRRRRPLTARPTTPASPPTKRKPFSE